MSSFKGKKKIIKQILFEILNCNTLLDINKKDLKCVFQLHYVYLTRLGFKSIEDIDESKSLDDNSFPQHELFMKLFDERIKFFEKFDEEKECNLRKYQMYPKLCELYEEKMLKKAYKKIKGKIIYKMKPKY